MRSRADSRHRGNARRLGLPTFGAGRIPAALAHGPGMDGAQRLILREFLDSDWPEVNEYASDPAVIRYMEWGPNSEKQTQEFIRDAISCQEELDRNSYEIAIILRHEHRLIGGGGIRVVNSDLREAEIGYVLNRNYWGL